MTAQPAPEPEQLAIPVCDDVANAKLEQINKGIQALVTRPNVAPFGTGSGHWAPGDTAAHPAVLSGPQGQNWNRAVRTVFISMSAAATLVIGCSTIIAGQVSSGELIRFKAPAAGVFTFDFGKEGILPGVLGSSGDGRILYWTDTGGLVVDILVVHG